MSRRSIKGARTAAYRWGTGPIRTQIYTLLVCTVAVITPSTAAEPSYQNRPISGWIGDLKAGTESQRIEQSLAVLRENTATAVPYLLAEIKANDLPPGQPFDQQSFERLERARAFLHVLEQIGTSACTPDAVTLLGNLATASDDKLAFGVVQTLANWGPNASNAIPQLLNGLSAQSMAGGPNRGAQFPPRPFFGRALAIIGPDSREVMMGLLTATSTLRTKLGFFIGGDVSRWCDLSQTGRPMLRAVVMDQIVPTPIRIEALDTLVVKRDTNVVPLIPALLDEPGLRIRAVDIVRRFDLIPATVFAAIVQAVARYGQEDQAFLKETQRQVMERGREHAATLVPQLLPLSFDERYPINCGFPGDQGVPVWIWARTTIQILDGGGQEVIKALRHPDWQVRSASAARLWGNSEFSPETIANLEKCLHDTNEVVRLSAAVTLSQVTSHKRAAVSGILSAAKSTTLSGALRLHAVRQLRSLHLRTADFPSVAPALKSALDDPDPTIRDAASQALIELTAPVEPSPCP